MKWIKNLFGNRQLPKSCQGSPQHWERVPPDWCLADMYRSWERNNTNANKYLIASFLPTRNGSGSEVFAVAVCYPEQCFWQWVTTKDKIGFTNTMLFDSVESAKMWIGVDAKVEIARKVNPFAISAIFCPNQDLIP